MVDGANALAPRLVWSVAALVHAVADALAARFAACVVRGEIAGFSRAASGHCYFNLKDAEGQGTSMRCAMFRRAAGLLDFNPSEGQLVELRGRVAVYEPRGELQFVVEAMQRAGAGALYEQFLRQKAKLEAEGLFDAARKRALPAYPRRVGVVTSLGAAALHDVATAFARRAPQVELIVYPSLVQGLEAPGTLVAAIALAAARAEVDVLIVCRGGGSLDDLWAFNDERVVRAIVACTIPVVCGVGHETDVTLADLAADLRAPTPTAAAELAAPARDALLAELLGSARRLARAGTLRLDNLQQHLDRIAGRMARPADRMGREQVRLALLARGLPQALSAALLARREGLRRSAQSLAHAGIAQRVRLAHREQQLATRLEALDPQRVIGRGYALVQTLDGALVASPAQIHAEADLRLTLARGQAELRVASVRRV